jgi:hypothetical protein
LKLWEGEFSEETSFFLAELFLFYLWDTKRACRGGWGRSWAGSWGYLKTGFKLCGYLFKCYERQFSGGGGFLQEKN